MNWITILLIFVFIVSIILSIYVIEDQTKTNTYCTDIEDKELYKDKKLFREKIKKIKDSIKKNLFFGLIFKTQ
jgi:hypothetical protein